VRPSCWSELASVYQAWRDLSLVNPQLFSFPGKKLALSPILKNHETILLELAKRACIKLDLTVFQRENWNQHFSTNSGRPSRRLGEGGRYWSKNRPCPSINLIILKLDLYLIIFTTSKPLGTSFCRQQKLSPQLPSQRRLASWSELASVYQAWRDLSLASAVATFGLSKAKS